MFRVTLYYTERLLPHYTSHWEWPMETLERASSTRLFWGGVLNVLLLAIPVAVLSSSLMQLAARILGEKVAWPQIDFMSAYPDDVRNGYLLFVVAVLIILFLSSGLFGGLFGASPGKMLLGIRYVRPDGSSAGLPPMLVRTGLMMLLLLPILLAGPLLGFVFGPAADLYSLIALGVGTALFVWLAFPWGGNLSWINRVAEIEPVRR